MPDKVRDVLAEITQREQKVEDELSALTAALKREPGLREELSHLTDARQALQRLVAPVAVPMKPKRTQRKPVGPPIPQERIRDWIRDHPEFVVADMATDFQRSESWVYKVALPPFIEKGIVSKRTVGVKNHYSYVPPSATPSVGSVAVLSQERESRLPVPGTGQQNRRQGGKDVKPLLNAARDQGFEVDQRSGGHIRVRNPKTGRSKQVSTASKEWHAHKKVRRDLVEIGVDC